MLFAKHFRGRIYDLAFTTLDLTVKTRNFGSLSMIAIVNAALSMVMLGFAVIYK